MRASFRRNMLERFFIPNFLTDLIDLDFYHCELLKQIEILVVFPTLLPSPQVNILCG